MKLKNQRNILAYICMNLSFFVTMEAFGKGLDQIQAEPDKPADSIDSQPENKPEEQDKTQVQGTQVQTAEVPDRFYLSSSLSWLNLSGDKGGWHTGMAGDFEAGYKFMTLMQKYDLFGTFRYRPVDAIVQYDLREYRAVVETYLFGVKARRDLRPKLSLFASAEIGASQTHMNPGDSLPNVDEKLEKSGVDLSLGTGVSYQVLEKFGVGAKFAVGTGAYQTVQLGVNLLFLL